MEYTYAALILEESGEELNETNLTAVLDAAGCNVDESRVKALVAALEGVDVDGVGPDAPTDVIAEEGPDEEATMASEKQPADPTDGTGTSETAGSEGGESNDDAVDASSAETSDAER